MRRGDWPTPRTAEMPDPPWPARDNAIVAALLDQARQDAAELGIEAAMIKLCVHSFFEGGIEGYDRGQADARAEPG